jgi:hypothetical protein
VWIAFPLADLLASSLTIALLVHEVRRLGRGEPAPAQQGRSETP